MRLDQIPDTTWVPTASDAWTADDKLQAGVRGLNDLVVSGVLSAGSTITVGGGVVWLPNATSGLLHRHSQVGNDTSKALGANPVSGHSRVDVLYAVYNAPGQAPTYQYVQGGDVASVLGTTYTTQSAGAAPAGAVAVALFLFSNSAGVTTITRFDRRPFANGNNRYQSTATRITSTAGSPGAANQPLLHIALELSGLWTARVSYGGMLSNGNSATNSDEHVNPGINGQPGVVPGYANNELDRMPVQNLPWLNPRAFGETFEFVPSAGGRVTVAIYGWASSGGFCALEQGQMNVEELVGKGWAENDQ